jgi:hypothetical protein
MTEMKAGTGIIMRVRIQSLERVPVPVRVFLEARKNYVGVFLFEQQPKMHKPDAHVHKVQIIFLRSS